jgi:apolipoprotein N-acyltransferase
VKRTDAAAATESRPKPHASGEPSHGRSHPLSITILLTAVYALLFALAFPRPNLWPLVLLAPTPLAWMALNARSTRRAIVVTAVVSILMWLWLDRWLIAVTPFGYPFYAIYLSLYGVAFVWIVRRLARRGRPVRVPMAIALPIVWVGLECLRGEFVFHGYAWYLLGHPLVEWPVAAQSADLFGAYFVSFVAASISGAIVDLLRWRTAQASSRIALAGLVWCLAIVGFDLVYGVRRTSQTESLRAGPRLLAIQTNLPQSNKIAWTREAQAADVPRFAELTRDALASVDGEVDLIVWPETMVPGVGLEPDVIQTLARFGPDYAYRYRWGVFVVQLAHELGTPMLVGSPALVGASLEEVTLDDGRPGVQMEHEHAYNSVYLIDGAAPFQRYDKYFLTPFGEVMPYLSAWPWLERQLLALGAPGMSFDLDSSPDLNLLDLAWRDETITLATPICFEDTVGRVCRRMVYRGGVKQADLFVNLSNDGWFAWFDAGRVRHAQIARFRCIENRVPMVRCVNTGLSLAIDSSGNLAAHVGDGRYGDGRVAGWLDAAVRLDDRVTLYGRIGESWAWACFAVMVIGLALTFRRSRTGVSE